MCSFVVCFNFLFFGYLLEVLFLLFLGEVASCDNFFGSLHPDRGTLPIVSGANSGFCPGFLASPIFPGRTTSSSISSPHMRVPHLLFFSLSGARFLLFRGATWILPRILSFSHLSGVFFHISNFSAPRNIQISIFFGVS